MRCVIFASQDSMARDNKLAHEVKPAITCFCKLSFIRTSPLPFIYILPRDAFASQGQNWITVAEISAFKAENMYYLAFIEVRQPLHWEGS